MNSFILSFAFNNLFILIRRKAGCENPPWTEHQFTKRQLATQDLFKPQASLESLNQLINVWEVERNPEEHRENMQNSIMTKQ